MQFAVAINFRLPAHAAIERCRFQRGRTRAGSPGILEREIILAMALHARKGKQRLCRLCGSLLGEHRRSTPYSNIGIREPLFWISAILVNGTFCSTFMRTRTFSLVLLNG